MKQNKQRTIFIFVSMAIAIGILVLLKFFFPGNLGAQLWGYGFTLLYVAYAYWANDALLNRFLIFAYCAGVTEVFTDAWAVNSTNTLFYPQDQPMIWASPLYMPFSWTVVFIQIGYVGFLLSEKMKMIYACLIMMVLSAVLLPVYEYLAIGAKWWYYTNTYMIGPVPVYIIIAEGLLMATIPLFYQKCEDVQLKYVPLLGVAQGLLILVCGLIAFYILPAH